LNRKDHDNPNLGMRNSLYFFLETSVNPSSDVAPMTG